MVNQLERTDTNLAANFNQIVNELSALNLANKTVIENATTEASAHLAALNVQITAATAYLTSLQSLRTLQTNTFTQNQQSREKLTTIEELIPIRLTEYPALSTNATNLKIESDQYVVGVSVLEFSPRLAELVTLGKQQGKVIEVTSNGAFGWSNSPSGSDRMATACYQIQAATGTGGGSAAPSLWVERGFTTTVKSTSSIGLSNGRVTLQPGSYVVWGYISCAVCGRFKSQFVNRTTNTIYKGSNVASTLSGDDFNGFSYFEAAFTLSSANSFSIETMVEATNPIALNTLGAPANIAGEPEVYGAIAVLRI
jgi:hypothetical protein